MFSSRSLHTVALSLQLRAVPVYSRSKLATHCCYCDHCALICSHCVLVTVCIVFTAVTVLTAHC